MEPKVLTKEGFKAFGIRYFGKNEKGEIPALWEKFMGRLQEEAPGFYTNESYGLMGMMDKEGNFEYIVCVPYTSPDQPLGDMVTYEIPKARYLVFAHIGSAETLQDTYLEIYNKYLPECEYEVRYDIYHFELYDERFNGFKEDCEMDIYVPIK